MRILLVLAAVVVAASAASLHFEMGSSEHDTAWASFKQRFSKRYPSPAHEAVRRVVWERNLRYIQKHNLEADLGKHTFRLGVNEYADLSNDEYRQQLLCRGLNTSRSAGALFLPPSNLALPSSVDWRSNGYVTGVKNQGQCGSCWAFSTTGSLEGQHFRKTNKLVSLSEQQLVDCSLSFGNNGCGGGLMDYAFRYIKANGGIDSEASYPYEARDDRCRFKRADVAATVTGYTDIEQFNETQLQIAAATVGPISVAIDAGHRSFQLYHEGVYNEPKCSQTALDHGVLVVGYGTNEGLDYWLVKNSWGVQWGQNGYIMMSRNKNNQCGIASKASYPLV